MSDKEKIRAEIERRYRENKADGYSNVCEELWDILSFIDSLQEEPVGCMWYDKDEEPCEDRQVLVCLSGNYYVDFYHKEDKRFYMFGNPKHYLCEVDKWAYTDDILNLSNAERTVKNWKEEPVSEDLEKVAELYTLDDSIKPWRNLTKEAFKAGAQWQKEKDQSHLVHEHIDPPTFEEAQGEKKKED